MSATILTGEYLFLAILEASYAGGPSPTAAANAMRVKANLTLSDVETEDMDYDAGVIGEKGSVEIRRMVTGDLAGYYAGSGTANLPSAITPLLKAAGLVITPDTDHVDITLGDITAAGSIKGMFYRGTASQVQPGARMGCEIEFSVDSLPRVRFPNYKALYNKQTNGAKPTGIDLSAFKNPRPTNPTRFTTKNIFGYDASISKVVIKIENEVAYLPESASVEIIDRMVSLEIEFKEPTPDVKDFYDLMFTYGAIDLQIGQDVVDEGHIFENHTANAQLTAVSQTERNKVAYLNCTFKCIPTAANNDTTMIQR
jgi:hypothetical protein